MLTLALALVAGMMGIAVAFREGDAPANPGSGAQLDRGAVAALAEGGHSVGPNGAPVSIVFLYSYSCGFSHSFQRTLDSLRNRDPGTIRITYKPVAGGSRADDVQYLAMECGAAQGRFEAVHRELLRDSQRPTLPPQTRWPALAIRAGVPDTSAFTRCIFARHFAAQLDSQYTSLERLGFIETPTALVNGRLVVGDVGLPTMEGIVQAELGTESPGRPGRGG